MNAENKKILTYVGYSFLIAFGSGMIFMEQPGTLIGIIFFISVSHFFIWDENKEFKKQAWLKFERKSQVLCPHVTFKPAEPPSLTGFYQHEPLDRIYCTSCDKFFYEDGEEASMTMSEKVKKQSNPKKHIHRLRNK